MGKHSDRNENGTQVKRIPYGISDYSVIREDNLYYVDKTMYLNEIEKAGKYLFFIRPRRFGKSLFLSMMKCYFDVFYKDQFEKFFKGTWIYDNPTEERGSYLVLFLNFSEVSPAVDKMEESFLLLVKYTVLGFIERYRPLLSAPGNLNLKEHIDSIKMSHTASDILGQLNRLLKSAGLKMYVIIDEYDNFANTLLTTSGDSAYRELTHGDGFLRTFFNVLKAGTGEVGSPISRLFITGVSPVTMDDVTSGFNIGKNVSRYSRLDQMLGFTDDDVKTMVEYYKTAVPVLKTTPSLMDMLQQWYGNYRFASDTDTPLFNTDMVLYFIDYCLQQEQLPENLIDRNVRIDYGKLRHLIVIDQGNNLPPTTNGNFSKLKEIIAEGGILSKVVDGFPLEEMSYSDNFNSLLFFFGLLTIAGREGDIYRMQIPNETIKHLYFDYINRTYRETGIFSMDLSKYAVLMSKAAFKGSWRPLFEFITTRMKESLALRDLITGEKAVQTFLNVYLGLSDLFIVHTERELNNGYADLLLEPYTARFPELNHWYLLELKYVKAGMTPEDPKLSKIIEAAEEQIRGYALDKKFKKAVGKTLLVKLVLIFSGHECIYLSDV